MYELLHGAALFIARNRIFFLVYLALANLTAFVLYAADKRNSKRGGRRIPESALIRAAVLGGSLGALAGMKLLRHKTKHRKFVVLIPLLLILQIAAAAAIIILSR